MSSMSPRGHPSERPPGHPRASPGLRGQRGRGHAALTRVGGRLAGLAGGGAFAGEGVGGAELAEGGAGGGGVGAGFAGKALGGVGDSWQQEGAQGRGRGGVQWEPPTPRPPTCDPDVPHQHGLGDLGPHGESRGPPVEHVVAAAQLHLRAAREGWERGDPSDGEGLEPTGGSRHPPLSASTDPPLCALGEHLPVLG